MTPTTPSPISDQAAGEDDAFEEWKIGRPIPGFRTVWKAACAWQRSVSTAPTTGSAPVAEYLAFAEFLESAGKSDIDAAKEIDTESYEPDDPTDIAMGLEFTGENYLKAAKIIRALLAASMGGEKA